MTVAVNASCNEGDCTWGKRRKEAYMKFLFCSSPTMNLNKGVSQLIDEMYFATDESDMRDETYCRCNGMSHKLESEDVFARQVDIIMHAEGFDIADVRSKVSGKADERLSSRITNTESWGSARLDGF